MRIQVLTIFPELFAPFAASGLVSRAIERGAIAFETVQLRDYAINSHGQIDDTPYGGGAGMVLLAQTASRAVEAAKAASPAARVILFSPRGQPLSQPLVRELAGRPQDSGLASAPADLILLCTRYEGVDERFIERYVDLEISLGDYILMGGETPAMALIEAISRLQPGVLNNEASVCEESFEAGLLEYPQYTKPQSWLGADVPPVLLSGDHGAISRWRKRSATEVTIERRPDLLRSHPLSCELSVALIHYPVHNKNGEIVTSSITNIDLHDIARSSCTFGLKRFYVVHPTKTLRRLAERICQHWSSGYGLTYNPNRSEALELISTVPDFEDVISDIENRTGKLPKLITTSAKRSAGSATFEQVAAILRTSTDPHLLILGTGWGLADELLKRADLHLDPVEGPTDYNHLSVRAAAGIMFDRLLGLRHGG